jgi:hypothetical protein
MSVASMSTAVEMILESISITSYVNYSDEALQAYQQDVNGNTENANHNWPEVARQSKIIR